MNLSSRTLRSLVPSFTGSADEAARFVAARGLRVAGVAPLRELLRPIVVARVEAVLPHPNADRLRICQVNDGGGRLLQIITGAPNVEAGVAYPLFRAGTTLPNGKQIRVGKLRGERSEGMLGSAVELELADESDGLMPLADPPAPGTPIADALDLGDEFVLLLADDPSEVEIRAALLGSPASADGAPDTPAEESASADFLRAVVARDVRQGSHGGRVVTRFPPEPNGHLHIGHAKSIILNFGVAAEFGGHCHLRFDDTNPETEDERYVRAIQEDVRWLGFDWGDELYFASDYFERMYAFAEDLIRQGLAYADGSSEEQVRASRGTVHEPGRPTPDRDRSVEENLDLFRRMRAGEFPNGAYVLRAKIDLGSPNMLMRDPVLYRIRHAAHYRTGDAWCIYPLYDFAHPIEDALECITHSFCTLEFEINRELYDWVVEHVSVECHPRQYEFARGNLDYTVMSKRKLLELVNGGYVSGWDDPRMPTLAGLRRRGVPPEAIRAFWERVGITKTNSRVDIGKLEFAIREALNPRVPRLMCVLRPLKVTITNYPEGRTEMLDAPLYPHDLPLEGSRPLPFGRELYIERDDFMENPPKGYHRLAPGREVRLRYAYLITCNDVVKDETGEVVELRCTYDPASRGGNVPDGRAVRGTIHWVAAAESLRCEVRLYDRLFTVPDPDARAEDFKTFLNPESLTVVAGARVEPSLAADPPGTGYQFERQGYFVSDAVDSAPGRLVFNRTVTLRDSWTAKSSAAPARAERKPAPTPAATRTTEPAAARVPERAPELEALRQRWTEDLGLGAAEADLLTRDAETARYFEETLRAAAGSAPPKLVANWVAHELPREAAGRALSELPFRAAQFAALVRLVAEEVVSSSAAREVLAEMARDGGDPAKIVERRGLRQVTDAGALAETIDAVLAGQSAKVEEYRAGKTGLLGFFTGLVMRASGGRANPMLVTELLRERLGDAAATPR